MAKFNHMGEAQSIRALAQYTEEIRDRFINLAIKHNINIITGSMPYVKEDGGLYNVGFLCRRDGTYEMYEKIHVTPDEVKSWGLSGGKRVQTFETDCAKIGVLICYDVEFPELSRLMADQGMQILFVPFLTDTQNGYSRVRVCAQHVPSKTNVLWLLPEVWVTFLVCIIWTSSMRSRESLLLVTLPSRPTENVRKLLRIRK